MENIKQQISDLKYQTGFIINQIKQLEQQVNKPKIEVGKWYKQKGCDYLKGLWCITKIIHDGKKEISFGFGGVSGFFKEADERYTGENCTLADEKEVNEALTKHADKLYEGVEKVDRSCIDISLDPIVKFRPYQDSSFDEDGFMYKGRYVMNSSGVWAKPCVSLKKMTIADIEKELGYKFELVKVG